MTSSIVDMLFSQLLTTSVSSAVVVAGVWLACRWLPGLPAAARATLWWLVAVKLLVGVFWAAPLTLPVLPEGPPSVLALVAPVSIPVESASSAPSVGGVSSPASARPYKPSVTWRSAAVLAWFLGLLALATRFVWQLRQSLRLLAQAVPADAGVIALARDAAARLGVSKVPEVRVSDQIAAPMLTGLRRARIVVPQDSFAALPRAEQRMALCHELAHYRRRDLWLGLVPALAERLFFFHPLARLAAREYLVAREAACDADAVAALAVRAHDYARLLLSLGVAPVPARFAAAGASRTGSNLKRRIVMLGLPSPTRRVRAAGWALVATALCAVVPVRLVGRAVEASVPATEALAIAVPAPTSGAAGVAAPGATQASGQADVTPDRDRLEYALMLGDSTMMSGAISSQRLDALRGSSPRLLWFKAGGREYVVRDEAAIARAVEITRPIREIGTAQGEVGSRQGAIGAQQGEVGSRQGAIGARQGAIGAKQAEIGARQAALAAREAGASDRQRQQLDRQRAELDAQMRTLDAQMRALDAEMAEADRPMGDLDAQMRVLDDEMRALDAKMHEAEPKVRAGLRALFEQLVAEKVAEPVK